MPVKSERTEASLYDRPRLLLVVSTLVLAVEEDVGHAEDAAAEAIVAKVVGMAEAAAEETPPNKTAGAEDPAAAEEKPPEPLAEGDG